MRPKHSREAVGVRQSVDELVLNWHLTEACNYNCQYCYAAWAKPARKRELFHDDQGVEQLLAQLYQFFAPNNTANPLAASLNWKHLRLSIAGGEPTLNMDRLLVVVNAAYKLGFRVSLITNGSRLDQTAIAALAPKLSCLGISVDSGQSASNRLIGRIDRFGSEQSAATIGRLVQQAKGINPSLTIKLNTVVNAINAGEDMTTLVKLIQPVRWKVLRVLPVHSLALSVTDSQFSAFVARHAQLSAVMAVEDNQDMVKSYIMVDPHGRFFQNQAGESHYSYSQPILAVGPANAFAEVGFAPDKFAQRYQPRRLAVAA